MKLFIEAFVSAIIAIFLLNFFGLSMYTLTSLTSFFVILLFLVIIEEKTGISNRRLIKQMRLERPILSTVISFIVLLLLALVFTVIHDRISIVVTPIINASIEIGMVGLALVLAVAYRVFYHIMFKSIDLNTGIDLGIKRRIKESETRTIIQDKVREVKKKTE
ncbi:hypothetical protein GF412_05600 [Candidatus Micrarchaeota archaeon]|nr:hypothetical protein [Candidatus Micrarchaeota archaeon]MBD3418423.1 hypothetical protein [Candidatus Micrarchaeota archaeon]